MSKRLRDVAEVHYGRSPNEVLTEDSPIPIIGTGGIYGRASRAMYNGPAVVVPRKGSLGNPQYVDEPFWPVDTTYAVIPKTGIDAKWLYYSLDTFDLTKLNEATGVPSISRDWLYKVPVGSGEYGEQHRIAEILSTVDNAIEQTEALIAKYQQIKAGLMHDLFTRGINPDGRLRPTRAQAPHLYKESPLGWIPREWGVVPIEDLCGDIVDCPHSTPTYVQSGIPCIRTADMQPGQLLLDQAYRVAEEEYWECVARLVPQRGDVIYSREGERLGIASPVGNERVCLGQRVMLLRPGSNTDPDFLLWAMNTPLFYRRIVAGLGATTSPHVNVGDIRKALLRRPSSSEQKIIGRLLARQTILLNAEELQLSKLKQIKQGLMHDLLTGRVCVKVAEPAGDTV